MSGALAIAGVGAAAAAASAYSSMKAGQQNAAAQDRAAGQAEAGLAAQTDLQQQILRQQRLFQTSTQVDADGNKIIYDPTANAWVPLLSQRGLQMQEAQRAGDAVNRVKFFGRQQDEETRNADRRLGEGSTADQLLSEIRNQYGAPTREGVVGGAKIAGVTPAGEANEALKSGAATSSLRQGSSAGTLGAQFAGLDRSAATGQRSALAQVDANPDMYNQILDQWRGGKLANYTPLATRASNIGNTPPPDSGQQALTAQIASRAAKPFNISPYTGATTNAANKDLVGALAGQKNQFPTGVFGGVSDQFEKIIKTLYPQNTNTTPTISRTSSTQTYGI